MFSTSSFNSSHCSSVNGTGDAWQSLQQVIYALGTGSLTTPYLPAYAAWASQGAGTGGAAIYNDSGSYKTLMIVGNNSAGGNREVKVWDDLTVSNNETVGGNLTVGGGTITGISGGVGVGAVAAGWYSDGTNLAVRAPSTAGGTYFQDSSGNRSWAEIGAPWGGINVNGNVITSGQVQTSGGVRFSNGSVQTVRPYLSTTCSNYSCTCSNGGTLASQLHYSIQGSCTGQSGSNQSCSSWNYTYIDIGLCD